MKLKRNLAISETGFIFDPTTGESYSLNPIATEILSLLKSGKTKEEVQHDVMERYDVDQPTFEHNYYDFTGMLKQFNLVENENKI